MVVIVDPHIKRVSSFPVYDEAESNGLIVKKSDNTDYEGWCWTGSSAWVDFFNPAATTWWKGLFSLVDQKWIKGFRWKESNGNMFIWNDMNEVGQQAMIQSPQIDVLLLLFSPPSSMGLRSPCQRTTFIMAVGNTVTSITSTACFS